MKKIFFIGLIIILYTKINAYVCLKIIKLTFIKTNRFRQKLE